MNTGQSSSSSSGPTVGVRPGAGLVVRKGPVVAAVAGPDGGAAVLDAIERFDMAAGSAADLLRVVRNLGPSSSVVVAVLGADVDVVLLGDVRCEVDGPNGHVHLEGAPAAQLVGLPSELHQVTVMLADAATAAPVRSALVDGIVPGGGADIRFAVAAPVVAPAPADLPASAPAPAPVAAPLPPPPPPVPAPPRPEPVPVQESASVVNVLLAPLEPEERPEPLPTTPEQMPPQPVEVRPMVRGLACGVGHVNRVDAPYCSACGRRLQGTINLIEGPRPSLGTLIFDDGASYGLERGYVIGREPEGDPLVVSGAAVALALSDEQRAISRVHAEIRLDGWDTQIVDRGSANGTHVAAPGGTGWMRLEPDVPTTLADGWSVAIGRRTFVFQQR